jgi:hypothetical protein
MRQFLRIYVCILCLIAGSCGESHTGGLTATLLRAHDAARSHTVFPILREVPCDVSVCS